MNELKISNNMIERVVSSSNDERMILIKPTKLKKLKIKILNIGGWIGLGICKSNFIQSKSFIFDYTNCSMKRGYYMISSNGYCWSDTDNNIHHKNFSYIFSKNQVICLSVDQINKKLIFESGNDLKTELFYEDCENDVYVFTINLCSISDSVEILELI